MEKSSMKKRVRFHNYRAPGFYMLTLVAEGRRRLFGNLVMHPKPYIKLHDLGWAIYKVEIPRISEIYPMVEVWRICMMPDHVHFIVRVRSEMPDGKHLGDVVRGFKTGANNAYWRLGGQAGTGLFEEGYNDRLLFGGDQLKQWKRYLADNPRRLALKALYPDLFKVLYDQTIHGVQCQMVGNQFLLDIPDKMAIVVHRSDSETEHREHIRQWMACGERGGVLVGTAISAREKEVMREARNRGYNIILLRDKGFPPLYKPSGEAFDACVAGELLEISPWAYTTRKTTITRSQCLYLNALADAICGTGPEPGVPPMPRAPSI